MERITANSDIIEGLLAWGQSDPVKFYVVLAASVFGLYYALIGIGLLAVRKVRQHKLRPAGSSGGRPGLDRCGEENNRLYQTALSGKKAGQQAVSKLIALVPSRDNLPAIIPLIPSLVTPPILVTTLLIILAQLVRKI